MLQPGNTSATSLPEMGFAAECDFDSHASGVCAVLALAPVSLDLEGYVRHILLSAITAASLSTGLAQNAVAADLPVKAPPIMVAAPANWAGIYIGLNAGAVLGDSRDTLLPTGCFLTNVACGLGPAGNPARTDTGNLNGTGATVGGQIGINWQSGVLVYGLETDINFSTLSSTDTVSRPVVAPLVGIFNHTVTSKLDWFGTLRARLGFTPSPLWLIYATGGLAYGQVKSSTLVSFTTTTDVYNSSASTTRVGWTAGAGAEWMFMPKWSAKFEYLYVDLGKSSYVNPCITAVCGGFAPPPTYTTNLSNRDHVLRIGINYHL
jgi:outer membrane immunogenic protein